MLTWIGKQWNRIKETSVTKSIVQVDKYLGTVLLGINSVILLIYMILLAIGGADILPQNILKLLGKAKIYGQISGVLLVPLIMIYLLFVIGAFGSDQRARGCRMLFISGVSIAGTGIIWWKCGISYKVWTQVLGIFILFLGFYFAQIYFNNRIVGTVNDNDNIEALELVKCRSDKIYVPLLIKTIKNQTLKERIANEVYTYVYGAYKYKRRHYTLLVLSIFFPAAVAAISGSTLFDEDLSNKIVPLLSMSAVIVSGIFSSFKAKESWSRYREYAEKAKNEIFCYAMGLEEYATMQETERQKLLAENMEDLFLEERKQWKELRNQK